MSPMSTCAGCGDQFEPKQENPGQKYHSHKCFLTTNNRDRARQRAKAVKAGAIRGEQMKAAASGQGYVKAPGDVHQHRVTAEQTLGRPLEPGEVVHHEDLDKQNNSPGNLIVFASQAQHATHHGLGHPGSPCDCPCIRLGGDA